MRHSKFKAWATDFATEVRQELQWLDPAKITALVFYCKSGRDRSVGCATIAENLFRRG